MFYIIVGIFLALFILYYLNLLDISSMTFTSLLRNDTNSNLKSNSNSNMYEDTNTSTLTLESSINELKNLNYYIDNGTSTSSPL